MKSLFLYIFWRKKGKLKLDFKLKSCWFMIVGSCWHTSKKFQTHWVWKMSLFLIKVIIYFVCYGVFFAQKNLWYRIFLMYLSIFLRFWHFLVENFDLKKIKTKFFANPTTLTENAMPPNPVRQPFLHDDSKEDSKLFPSNSILDRKW